MQFFIERLVDLLTDAFGFEVGLDFHQMVEPANDSEDPTTWDEYVVECLGHVDTEVEVMVGPLGNTWGEWLAPAVMSPVTLDQVEAVFGEVMPI